MRYQKILKSWQRKKNNLIGDCSLVLARVICIYLTDNDTTYPSSDDDENHQGEKSKRQKGFVKKYHKMERPRSLQRWYPLQIKKIQNHTKKM